MSVANKVVLITGGASGIGRASALLLATHGARVVIADRNPEMAKAASVEITSAGGQADDVEVDVADSASVNAMVDRCVALHGRIDVLLHCAGVCPRCSLLEMTDQNWRDVMSVNLDGTFYVARDVAKIMTQQRAGTMILLTSDRGVNGSPDYPHYAASKGGTIALAKSLAIALGSCGVTVNALNPGMTDTPLARGAITEEAWRAKTNYDVLGSFSQPDEIAETVLFLAGPAASFMTGQIVGTRMRNFA